MMYNLGIQKQKGKKRLLSRLVFLKKILKTCLATLFASVLFWRKKKSFWKHKPKYQTDTTSFLYTFGVYFFCYIKGGLCPQLVLNPSSLKLPDVPINWEVTDTSGVYLWHPSYQTLTMEWFLFVHASSPPCLCIIIYSSAMSITSAWNFI